MKNYTVKPFHKLLEVRPDVRDGTLDQSAYAANLGDVISEKPVGKEYHDPELFEEMTYKTKGMKRVLNEIRERLQDGKGNGVRQIEIGFGGGKTHAMIAMYHECRKWGANPVVIDGQALSPSNTLWGAIEKQLDGNITKMTGNIAPSGDQIYQLLSNRSKPILILIDEMFNYIGRAAGILVGKSDLAAQTILFMQNLNGVIGSIPNVCLVMSLSARDDVIQGDSKTAKTQNEHYTTLRKIVRRHHQLSTVAEDNDISHIIRRRLFSTRESIISERARDTIQYCIREMKESGSLNADEINEYEKRFNNTYPFTPEVIDVLHKRWGSYPTFQRTRAVLRLLSQVVHSMLKSDRAWIAPGDIDLSIQMIQRELLQYTGDNTESALVADITGTNPLAKKAGKEGMRCASSIFMYSFPSGVGGATHAVIKRSTFTQNASHYVIGDTISRLLQHCYFIRSTDEKMLLFDIKPNLNQMIDNAKHNVRVEKVEEVELSTLKGSLGGKFENVIVWPDETESYNIPDRPELQLIICKRYDPEWCKKVVNGTKKSRRINMNGLVFLLPGDGLKLDNLLRSYLGVQAVQQMLSNTEEYTTNTRTLLNNEVKRFKESIGNLILEKYCIVYLPSQEGVSKIRDYTFNPRLDGGEYLDVLLWNRLVSDDHIATSIAPDTAKQYGDDADSVYATLVRTPGEVMPASLEVVQRAFEKETPPIIIQDDDKDEEDDKNGGDEWGDDDKGDDDKGEPEKTHGHVKYYAVVDAVKLGDIRSLFASLSKLSLTAFDCNVKLRADGKYEARFEMKGKIPDRIVSSIDQEYVKTVDDWGD